MPSSSLMTSFKPCPRAGPPSPPELASYPSPLLCFPPRTILRLPSFFNIHHTDETYDRRLLSLQLRDTRRSLNTNTLSRLLARPRARPPPLTPGSTPPSRLPLHPLIPASLTSDGLSISCASALCSSWSHSLDGLDGGRVLHPVSPPSPGAHLRTASSCVRGQPADPFPSFRIFPSSFDRVCVYAGEDADRTPRVWCTRDWTRSSTRGLHPWSVACPPLSARTFPFPCLHAHHHSSVDLYLRAVTARP